MKQYIFLALIVLTAGFLRFWHITSVPPALNSDEVAIGYNAYSVLKTGKDEYGAPHPFLFRSFDDYKMPVYPYLVAGSMALFGAGDFAIRFPSALLGTLTVLFTYLLAYELFRKKSVSLIAGFLLAVSPWSLQFSRAGYEANAAVFFVVLGTYLFLRKWYIFSAVIFSVSVWSYLTPRIFVPLLAAGMAIIYRKELWKQKYMVLISVVVAVFLLWPIARMSLSPQGQMRAAGVSAFTNADDLKKSVARLSRDPAMLRIFDNRRITYVITFLRGYFEHFDPTFLFLDKSIEKYRAPDVGLLYVFEMPLILAGLYWLARRWNSGSALLFWWLLVSPVAAAFTLQLPHPVRTLVFLPSFQIVAAVGAVAIARRRIIAYVLGAVAVVNIMFYFHQYYRVLPVEDAPYWYYGRQEMSIKIAKYQKEFDRIYVSNSLDFPYIFYLYYNRIDPSWYQKQGGTVSGGFEEQGNHVENVSFRSINTSLRNPLEKILFVGMPGEVFKKSLVVDTVKFPDGSPAVEFFE